MVPDLQVGQPATCRVVLIFNFFITTIDIIPNDPAPFLRFIIIAADESAVTAVYHHVDVDADLVAPAQFRCLLLAIQYLASAMELIWLKVPRLMASIWLRTHCPHHAFFFFFFFSR